MTRCIVALFVICLAGISAASQSAPAAAHSEPSADSDEFVIGPEDVLSINVWKEPDFSTTVTVRPDGKISIPLLNDLTASGLTTRALQEKIAQGLEKFVTEPMVTVIVVEIHSQVVHIVGAVGRPGAYALGHPLTIVELLARAGGLSESARDKEILVVRTVGDKTRRFRFNYTSFAEGKNFQQNIQLRSGDVIIIP